jgi:hypothetical protein
MQAKQLLNLICGSFQGVTLGSGISWSRSMQLDDGKPISIGNQLDQPWILLVDDANWISDPAIGGLNYLDADGFRYYIAPIMIRCIRGDMSIAQVADCLYPTADDFRESQWRALSIEQRAAIAEFLLYCEHKCHTTGLLENAAACKRAYSSYWYRYHQA